MQLVLVEYFPTRRLDVSHTFQSIRFLPQTTTTHLNCRSDVSPPAEQGDSDLLEIPPVFISSPLFIFHFGFSDGNPTVRTVGHSDVSSLVLDTEMKEIDRRDQ